MFAKEVSSMIQLGEFWIMILLRRKDDMQLQWDEHKVRCDGGDDCQHCSQFRSDVAGISDAINVCFASVEAFYKALLG